MGAIAERLRAGDVVVLRDAFRPEFAEMVYQELSDKHVAWELNEAYFPDGCARTLPCCDESAAWWLG